MTSSTLPRTRRSPRATGFPQNCRVILVCNFPPDRQESILRYGDMLFAALSDFGVPVSIVQPKAMILSRLPKLPSSAAKWVGYIDKFVLFPRSLKEPRRVGSERIIYHIMDHGNAPYLEWVRWVPHVVTCHDALAIRSALGEIPENQTSWSGRILQKWILRNLKASSMVACVSAQTEREIRRLTELDTERTTVIPHALNYPYKPMSADESGRALSSLRKSCGNWDAPFYFHVGGSQWYKNREGVIDLFVQIRKLKGYGSLVMAGKPHTKEIEERISRSGCSKYIHYVGEVTSEELNALYASAEALLFPSLAEGFGWPIIEAQAAGCAVFTTGAKPMTDVGGAAARYFDPKNIGQAADIVVRALGERETIIQEGLANAAKYTVDAMVSSYVDLYVSILRNWTNRE
jgi:glycosyltransferase involved in cell wall biosynthesis